MRQISEGVNPIFTPQREGWATRPICPMFIVNARFDELTPGEKCVEFYASLLKAGFNAEIHVFSKGGHGFGMGDGRGNSTALWPTSFVAWLRDCGIVEDY